MENKLIKAVKMCRTTKEQEEVMVAILKTLKIEKGSPVYYAIYQEGGTS